MRKDATYISTTNLITPKASIQICGEALKTKLWLFLVVLSLGFGYVALVNAQTSNIYWIEQFSYYNVDQMQAAGWTLLRPAGISMYSNAVVLDGTGGDCAISHTFDYSNSVYNWKAEVRSMWLGHGHSVLSVFVYTENHSYGFACDGYNEYFSLYRDSKKVLTFGNYQEETNQYFVLSMVREGNTFSFYVNGDFLNSYNESDTASSKVTGLGLVSPWLGDAKYDYILLGEPTAVTPSLYPTEETSGFPIVPVVVGASVTVAIIGGVLYYFYVVVGSNPAASPPAGGSPGTKPPAGKPPGVITAGGGPGGPPTAPFATPTTAPFTTPAMAPGTAPTTAPYTTPTTAPYASLSTAPGTAPTTAPYTAPTTAPYTAPTTAPGTSPATAPYSAPTTAPGQIPATSPYVTPTTAPGTTPSTASQIIPNPPPLTVKAAAEIISSKFQGIWQGKEVAKTTIISQLKNLGMNTADAQIVIDKLVRDGVIKLSKPGYYEATS
jgi:hypothetical protein